MRTTYSMVIMIKILIMAGQDALMPPGGGKSETSLGRFSNDEDDKLVVSDAFDFHGFFVGGGFRTIGASLARFS